MSFNRYNVPMRRLLPRVSSCLVAAAGLVTLSPAQGGVFPGSNGPDRVHVRHEHLLDQPGRHGQEPDVPDLGASDPSWSSGPEARSRTSTPPRASASPTTTAAFPGRSEPQRLDTAVALVRRQPRRVRTRRDASTRSQSFGGGELPLDDRRGRTRPGVLARRDEDRVRAEQRRRIGFRHLDDRPSRPGCCTRSRMPPATSGPRPGRRAASSIVYSAAIDARALRAPRPSTSGIATPTDLGYAGHRSRVLAGRNEDRLHQYRRAISR